MNFDFSKTLAAAKKVDPSTTSAARLSSGSSKYSVSIVNNDNGMRVQISAALTAVLGLTDTAEFLPIEGLRQFLVSRELPMDAAVNSQLKERAKAKIAYNAELVRLLTDTMRLQYDKGRTSRAFTDIRIEHVDDVPVAVVIVDDASVISGKLMRHFLGWPSDRLSEAGRRSEQVPAYLLWACE